ncbi:MAG: hypothetical protein IJX16_00955, partial [Clostridia bacterium]|nr:hypothetical protein [Clostridia bacterium]
MKVNKFRAFTLVLILALVSLSFLKIPTVNMGHAESIQTINLINNGSFESGANTNFFGNKYYVPTNWSSYSDFCVHEDKTLAYEGSKSIKIDSIGDGFYLQTSNDLQAKGDTCYRIGYMVRATDVSETSFGLTVTSLDDSGKVVETFTIEGICLKTAEEWQEISLYAGMQSTVNSVSIKLDVDYSGANGCNIDAVFMEEISCVKINDGASVRKTKDSPGLRFSGTVDKYTYDLFNDSYKNVSAGIVIFPKVYYEKISNFTFYDIDKSGLDYLDIE